MTNVLFPELLQDPDELLEQAVREHKPVASVCLFSGGSDSRVLAVRCKDWYDQLCFIDTGTAVPGVREHVQEFAAWLGKPLLIYEAGDAFRRLVLEHGGFPGPAGHGRAYTRLKERQIEAIVRDRKRGHPRSARVMLLTGKRRAESARRAKSTLGIDRRGGQLYVNPLIDWDNERMREFRERLLDEGAPENDVAALLHRSGECNCGAFAEPGEREMLQSLWPSWFEETIAQVERDAEAAGVPACKWGQRPPEDQVTEPGPLCSSCEWRQMDIFDMLA